MADTIYIVDQILAAGIQAGASDIHLEPYYNGLRVRYRIDGMLYDQASLDLTLTAQVIARVKVLANLDIAQRRLPQDGKIQLTNGPRVIDLRVATFPATTGEKLVIRILDRNLQPLQLTELGFSVPFQAQLQRLIQYPAGFLLVTGPTGSGKTTTLYAALQKLHTPERHIITLEDPIEYQLAGITQGQIQPETGFTFAKGIKALLRQDPDVVMIGEIRDRESAKIAIEAALAGRLVFSTLHTNSAAGAMTRLIDMGIEAFLINAAVTGVVAQRLVRKLCLSCRVPVAPTADEQRFMQQFNFKSAQLYQAPGCAQCQNLGYRGRLALAELLVMTDALRELLSAQPKLMAIQQQAEQDGMVPLFQDGLQKVAAGEIALAELLRVIAH